MSFRGWLAEQGGRLRPLRTRRSVSAAPAGIDPAIVKTLHDAFKKGMDEPSYVATMVTLDQEPFYLNSEDYRKFALQQIEEQRELVKDLGLKAN